MRAPVTPRQSFVRASTAALALVALLPLRAVVTGALVVIDVCVALRELRDADRRGVMRAWGGER